MKGPISKSLPKGLLSTCLADWGAFSKEAEDRCLTIGCLRQFEVCIFFHKLVPNISTGLFRATNRITAAYPKLGIPSNRERERG
jgi:hypothetical protein